MSHEGPTSVSFACQRTVSREQIVQFSSNLKIYGAEKSRIEGRVAAAARRGKCAKKRDEGGIG